MSLNGPLRRVNRGVNEPVIYRLELVLRTSWSVVVIPPGASEALRLTAPAYLRLATNMRNSDKVIRTPFNNGDYNNSTPGESARIEPRAG